MAERLTFEIGEVAVLVHPRSPFYGQECTVVSPLIYGPIYDRIIGGEATQGAAYKIEAPWLPPNFPGKTWGARPEHLKKRPPKQDWKTLCNLKEVDALAPV